MSFRIVTDSSCDLTPQELFKLGIASFPIGITIGNESYPDKNGYFPDVDEFYKLQAKAKNNSTGSMGPNPVIEAFTPALQGGHDILYIGIDYELSEGTMNHVAAAKEILQEQFPERRIEIPATHCIAPGLGLLLTRMADFCKNDVTLDEALTEMERLSHITAHWFTVNDYTQLRNSGRMSNVERLAAKMLSLKLLMVLPYHGILKVYEKLRGKNVVMMKRFVEEVANTIETDDRRVWISYGASSELANAKEIEKMLHAEMKKRNLPPVETSFHRIGPLIGCHVGPTVLAVFFFADKRA